MAPAPALRNGRSLEALLTRLGPFGFYQRYALLLLLLPSLLAPMHAWDYVFVAAEVPFRCAVPECEDAERAQFGNLTARALLVPNDACRRLAPRDPARSTCDPAHFHADRTVTCDRFVYEHRHTMFAEFDLACRGRRRALAAAARFAALPLAPLLGGYVADRWGRRVAFCASSACAGALGLAKSVAPNYGAYVALEFLMVAFGQGFADAAYVMAVELARPSLRAAYTSAVAVAQGLGGALLAAVASRVPRWRHLLRAISTPALGLPCCWLLLDENVRWLHASDRLQEAAAVVEKIARWNKVALDTNFIKESLEQKAEETSEVGSGPWLGVLRSRALLLRLGVCCFCRVAAGFLHCGITFDTAPLSSDRHVDFALNMAMEVAASLLVVMALERIGRRLSISVAFLLCGLCSVLPAALEREPGRVLYFGGKLSVASATNALCVLTVELSPTRARASSLAVGSLAGRVGFALAPWVSPLGDMARAGCYGACALAAASAMTLVPETRRAPLPQRSHRAGRPAGVAPAPGHLHTARPRPPPAPSFTRVTRDVCRL